MTCTVDDCEGRVVARGYCGKHYTRWKRWGDPAHNAYATRQLPVEERYWANVEVRGPDDCWPWTASLSPHGYGRFRSPVSRLAHRFGFWLANGYLPETTDHECHNRNPHCPGGDTCPHRACNNPAHLVDHDAAENARRGKETRARCKRGHELPESRERWDKYKCPVCYREAKQRSNAVQAERRKAGRPRPGEHNRSKTACAQDHPYDEANTGYSTGPDGSRKRYCKECHRIRAREYARRKRDSEPQQDE